MARQTENRSVGVDDRHAEAVSRERKYGQNGTAAVGQGNCTPTPPTVLKQQLFTAKMKLIVALKTIGDRWLLVWHRLLQSPLGQFRRFSGNVAA